MVRKTSVRAGNRQRRSSPPIQGSSASKNSKKSAAATKKSQPKKEAQIQQDEPTPARSPTDAALTHEQQLTLNIFRNTFHPVLTSPDFTSTLQTIKQALFDRD